MYNSWGYSLRDLCNWLGIIIDTGVLYMEPHPTVAIVGI